MTVCLETVVTFNDQPFEVAMHGVRCLVKRRAYALVITLPHSPHTMADEVQVRLYVLVKWPGQAGRFMLSLQDVERCYEDLLQMVAYIQTEPQKVAMTTPAFSGRHADILADVREIPSSGGVIGWG